MTTNFTNNKNSRKFASKFANIHDFNIIIVGTGGQGQITLLQILAQAAFSKGYEIKTSELHGLSQRGGSVEVHLRFTPPRYSSGGTIYSPLVAQAKADFILALEIHEALRGLYYTNENSQFLIDRYSLPIPGQSPIPEKEILNQIKKFTQKIDIIPANEICQKKFGKGILAGIYLISYASFKNLIPLKPLSILKAIGKIIPKKYLELNQKTFKLAESILKSQNENVEKLII